MPYIKQELRHDLLESTIHELINLELTPGDLNFIISSLIWSRFEKHKRYATGNELMGVLECVKHEFYRRRLSVYEDQKVISEGDLDV